MKIRTADGKVFDVPEENVESFFTDYNSANVVQKSDILSDLDEAALANRDVGEQIRALHRSSDFAGALRNFAQGLTFNRADEIEASLGADAQGAKDWLNSLSQEEKALMRADRNYALERIKNRPEYFRENAYNKLKRDAEESAAVFMAEHPVIGTGLNIAGGMLPAVATLGATAPATGLTIGKTLARSIPMSTAGGAIAGWNAGNDETRLENALFGAGLGLVGGTVAPIATLGVGSLGRGLNRARVGWASKVSPQQVEGFTLGNVLTEEGEELADILRRASESGAKDIKAPLVRLNKIWQNANNPKSGLRTPRAYKATGLGGTTVAQIEDVVPSTTAKARIDFPAFVEAKPAVEQNVGWKAGFDFQKRNPSAAKILEKVKGLNDIDPDSFEWWQRAEQELSKRLPSKIPDATKLTGETKKIYDAVNDISATRDKLFSGTQKINEQYLIGKVDERVQPSRTTAKLERLDLEATPFEPGGGIFETINRFVKRPVYRGIGRQLIKTGQLPAKDPVSSKVYQGTSSVADAIVRSLLGW